MVNQRQRVRPALSSASGLPLTRHRAAGRPRGWTNTSAPTAHPPSLRLRLQGVSLGTMLEVAMLVLFAAWPLLLAVEALRLG